MFCVRKALLIIESSEGYNITFLYFSLFFPFTPPSIPKLWRFKQNCDNEEKDGHDNDEKPEACLNIIQTHTFLF